MYVGVVRKKNSRIYLSDTRRAYRHSMIAVFFLVRGKIAAAKTGRVKPWRRAEWVRVFAFFFPNIITKLFFLIKKREWPQINSN